MTPTRRQLAACFLLVAGCSDESAYHGTAGGTDVSTLAEYEAGPLVPDGGLPQIGAAQAAEAGAAEAGSQPSSASSFVEKLNAAIAEDPGSLSCARTFLDESAADMEQARLVERTQIAAVLRASAEQLTLSWSLPCGATTRSCGPHFYHDALAFGGGVPQGLVTLVQELENTSAGGEYTSWAVMGALAASCAHAPIDGRLVGVCVIGGGSCAARGL